MNKLQRKQVFDYVYSKADQASYMAMESPASTAFQDGLESDADLFAIAGEQLTRKYIKDTILNRYSKDRRYIDASDVIAVITGLVADDVVGTKAEFGNGIFHVLHNGQDIRCTSVSFNQWETSIKRFGKWDKKEIRFVFLTCGGVSQSEESILNVKDILASLGMIAFIVKPNDPPRDISTFIKSLPPSNSALPHAKLDLAVFFSDLTSANLSIDKKLVDRFVASLCTKPLCIITLSISPSSILDFLAQGRQNLRKRLHGGYVILKVSIELLRLVPIGQVMRIYWVTQTHYMTEFM